MFFSNSSEFDDRVSVKASEFCEQVISEMGAELHDDVIQKLTAMSFHIERIERASNDPLEIINLTSKMKIEFEGLIQSIRAISRRLNPVHRADATFEANIGLLCESMQRPGNGHIDFSSSGTEQPISQLAFTYLYRIIQELIHNAFRHSAAWRVDVKISWLPATLLIQVEDDGTAQSSIKGITATLQSKHNTLNMRAHAINASIRYVKGKRGLLARVEYPLL
jgi:signal transduction histidine kinase